MKKLIILSLLCFLTFTAFAQHDEKRERVKALKIAFITEQLNLTETEAQKFWPIYNAFEDNNNKLRREAVITSYSIHYTKLYEVRLNNFFIFGT